MSDTLSRCLLCDSDNLNLLSGYETHYLQKCANCGFVFCYKKPTEQELIAHYNLYQRSNAISPITIRRYEQLLTTFDTYRKTSNILDVGCGDGFFLQVAKQKGWNVFGTEFTDEALRVCREKGIEMKQGRLDANNYAPGFFDVVTSFEVIEHINNPKEDVPAFNKILRKDGIVYLTTPNFNSISRDLLKAKWNVIEYPEHLSYYTASTIKKLFRQFGFRTKKISTTGLSIDRIRRSNNTQAVAATDESVRQTAESNAFYKSLIRMINFSLDLTKKGDSLKATFVKDKEI